MEFRGFKGNAAPKGAELLRVTKEGVELNGERSEIADMIRHFTSLGDKKAPILILPTDEAPMTLVGKVLKGLSDAGLENTSLSMELKEAEALSLVADCCRLLAVDNAGLRGVPPQAGEHALRR